VSKCLANIDSLSELFESFRSDTGKLNNQVSFQLDTSNFIKNSFCWNLVPKKVGWNSCCKYMNRSNQSPFCERCRNEGLVPEFLQEIGRTSTSIHCPPIYNNGGISNQDWNVITTTFRCSNEHIFVHKRSVPNVPSRVHPRDK